MSAPKTQTLPSLHALRAFEATARLGSFKDAAADLNVSPTAISHHVRGLEEDLGVKLFDRRPRRVVLTAVGKQLATAATAAMSGLAHAIEEIRKDARRRRVTMAAGPFIASRWVIPLLGHMHSIFPDADLRLNQILGEIDPSEVGADIILAWGDGAWPGFAAQKLWTIRSVPVANPDLARRIGKVQDVSTLLEVPLVHHRDESGWARWFASTGLQINQRLRGTIIEDANMVIRSVVEGYGIALGWMPLINAEIEAGEIVKLTHDACEEDRAYYLLHDQRPAHASQLQDVVSWLSGAAETTPKVS